MRAPIAFAALLIMLAAAPAAARAASLRSTSYSSRWSEPKPIGTGRTSSGGKSSCALVVRT